VDKPPLLPANLVYNAPRPGTKVFIFEKESRMRQFRVGLCFRETSASAAELSRLRVELGSLCQATVLSLSGDDDKNNDNDLLLFVCDRQSTELGFQIGKRIWHYRKPLLAIVHEDIAGRLDFLADRLLADCEVLRYRDWSLVANRVRDLARVHDHLPLFEKPKPVFAA